MFASSCMDAAEILFHRLAVFIAVYSVMGTGGGGGRTKLRQGSALHEILHVQIFCSTLTTDGLDKI